MRSCKPASPCRVFALLAALCLILPGAVTAQKWKNDSDFKKLDLRHQSFLEYADLLIKKKERKEFMALAEPWQRDDFVKAFWLSLDPFPETSINEFREMWLTRWEIAAEEFGEDVLNRPRAIAFLTQGSPQQKIENPCSLLFWPVEIWIWNNNERYGRVIGLFYDPGETRRYRQWTTLEDPGQLIKFPLRPLTDIQAVQRWLDNPANTGPQPQDDPNNPRNAGGRGRRDSFGISDMDSLLTDSRRLYGLLEMMMNECPGESDIALLLFEAINQQVTKPNAELTIVSAPSDLRDGEGAKRWLEAWKDRSTDLPASGEALAAELALSFPGRRMSRTVVDGTLLVPKVDSPDSSQSDPVAVNAGLRKFELNGEVLKEDRFEGGDRLHESFRYRFEMTDAEVAGEVLPLSFRRYLRPGSYTLRVRLEEVDTGRFFRSEIELIVPTVEAAEGSAAPDTEELTAAREDLEATLAAEEDAVLLDLVAPEVPVFTGYQRFEASVDGEVSKVAFLLDGKEMLRRSREPWTVEMKLGDVPRPHVVEAVAFDAAGVELARDRVALNQGEHRFAINIIEPKPDGTVDGNRFIGRVTLRAALQLPEDQTFDRVEIYRNETLLSTLYQEPFEQPVQLDDTATVLRTVAYLEDGNATEDVVLLNVPGTTERLRVHLVELSVGASASGRPVLDLERDEVVVSENGQPQKLLRFESVRDLPLHLLVLLDTSGSMQDRIEEMRDVALRFFEQAVSPRDRVSVVTFHEQQTIRVDFTSDFEQMKKGLRYLSTGQGTHFYDALIFSLYRFQGIKGQRALLLLSDGKDSGSKTTWEEALEYSRQSGVTIYPIGLKGIKRSPQASGKLDSLAKESGGRGWFVKDIAELEGVYKKIVEELRARYLISYQTVVEEGQGFKPVAVSTTRQGVVIEAPSGYYP